MKPDITLQQAVEFMALHQKMLAEDEGYRLLHESILKHPPYDADQAVFVTVAIAAALDQNGCTVTKKG